jgi:hypothetical protein
MIAWLVLTFLLQHSLNRSVWGNPFTFGLAVNSILNTLGMVLLCGMFKDVQLPIQRLAFAVTSNRIGSNKVAAAREQKGELGSIIDSRTHSSSAGNYANIGINVVAVLPSQS